MSQNCSTNKKNNYISNSNLSPLILQIFGKKIFDSPEHVKSLLPTKMKKKIFPLQIQMVNQFPNMNSSIHTMNK
jgi:hypothetical protein